MLETPGERPHALTEQLHAVGCAVPAHLVVAGERGARGKAEPGQRRANPWASYSSAPAALRDIAPSTASSAQALDAPPASARSAACLGIHEVRVH